MELHEDIITLKKMRKKELRKMADDLSAMQGDKVIPANVCVEIAAIELSILKTLVDWNITERDK